VPIHRIIAEIKRIYHRIRYYGSYAEQKNLLVAG